ncbi:hypothetical protein BLJ79_15085 [Arthrobacter sp. UCD-GKA]|uniref:hypothetical protein n=1 Tax=Arthrobacter sp. UCD-GKA TaxID=1913576 RepID=UPI0008DC77C1|nr:hypothetical protein [Arthrobacter sp. UCD-GKA]OIH83409.1 hypothetical protein BLJ79_15085 [Arthrobacter sp. UCD-GKA]
MPTPRLQVLADLGILGLAGSFLVSGCASSNPCLPEPMSASAAAVEAGASLVVSAPSATCNLGYGPETTYGLTLISVVPPAWPPVSIRVPVNQDGSFSTRVRIPKDFPAGDATVLVTGSPLDGCGTEGSCAAYSVSFTVQR